MMSYGICTFCTMRQKWQNDELWDLNFLHNEANVAKINDELWDLHFLHNKAKVAKVVGFALFAQ